jgi:uncharacterized protein YceH (UPF0502 family)
MYFSSFERFLKTISMGCGTIAAQLRRHRGNQQNRLSLIAGAVAAGEVDEPSNQKNSLQARIDELLKQMSGLLAHIAELEARSGKPPKTPAAAVKRAEG